MKNNSAERIYLDHNAAIALLLGWVRRWSQTPEGARLDRHEVILGRIASQRFGLAWPKKKRHGDGPSLLYQSTEAAWMERLCWSRAVLSPRTGDTPPILSLVTRRVVGDDMRFMNIPVFALRMQVSDDFADLWRDIPCRNLPLRQMWKDEDDVLEIARPIVTIPLFHDAHVLTEEELAKEVPFHELLEKRLRMGGVEENPGFAGSVAAVEDPYLKAQTEYRQSLARHQEDPPDVVPAAAP